MDLTIQSVVLPLFTMDRFASTSQNISPAESGLFEKMANNNNNNNNTSDKPFTSSSNINNSCDLAINTGHSEQSAGPQLAEVLSKTPLSSLSPASNSDSVSTGNKLFIEFHEADSPQPMCSEASSACSPTSAGDMDQIPSNYGMVSMSGRGPSSMSPFKTSPASMLAAVRCPPVREAVDPAKYITINGEPDGVKYACSKCGNVYKWRKSLNKHWKEKHDGEIPDPNQTARFVVTPKQQQQLSPYSAEFRQFPSTSGFDIPAQSSSSPSQRQVQRSSLIQCGGMPSSLYGKFGLEKSPPLSTSRGSTPQEASTSWNRRVVTTGPIQFPMEPKLKVPTFDPTRRFKPETNYSSPLISGNSPTAATSRPVDLSGALPSHSTYSVTCDDTDSGVLDLSKKSSPSIPPPSFSSSFVQDEPLDFSTKVATGPTSMVDPLLDAANFFRQSIGVCMETRNNMDNSINLEPAHRGASLERRDTSCAQCRLKFSSPSKLNRHFSRDHGDVLMLACSGDASQATGGGSAQLYRYLTTGPESGKSAAATALAASSTESVSCIVCGASFLYRWAAARHFDQDHSGIGPNPYQTGLSTPVSPSFAGVDMLTKHQSAPTVAAAGNLLTCPRCPFVTDSFPVFARHQLHHSPRRPTSDQAATAIPNLGFWVGSGVRIDDNGELKVDLLSGADEHTAIVIPQAPEDTAAAAAVAAVTAALKANPVLPSTVQHLTVPKSSLGSSISSGSHPAPVPKSSRIRKEIAAAGPGASAEALLPFKCELCEYRARWPSEMTQHAKNHSDEKPYHCPQCSYRSKWKWDVVKHLKRCGGGGTARDVIDTTQTTGAVAASAPAVTTSTCTASFGNRRRRPNNAMKLTLPVGSLTEARGVESPGSVMAGSALVGTDSDRMAVAALSLASLAGASPATRELLSHGPPNVTVCAINSPQPIDNNLHRDKVDGNENADENTVPVDSSTDEKDGESNGNSQNGSVSVTVTPPVLSIVNQGLHYCIQCPFVGHSPAELRRHLRVHSDEKPYNCRSCSYSSKWKCDLKKHIRAYSHVSGVPLVYAGHGRKPTSDLHFNGSDSDDAYSDDESVPSVVVRRASDNETNGHHANRRSGMENGGAFKNRRQPNGFAGVTAGGRLRCRRCDFEAIDITSFLQHKSFHSAMDAAGERKYDLDGLVVDGVASTLNSTAKPLFHHRRKSAKQTRVVPEENHFEKAFRSEHVSKQLVLNGQKELEGNEMENNGSRFWESLGLKSKSDVSELSKSQKFDQQQSGFPSIMTQAADIENSPASAYGHQEIMEEDVTSSQSTEADVDYVCDAPIDLCDRREVENCGKTLTAARRSPVVSVERITTSDVEQLTGSTKRKRKVRSCDKCGYITDNLTTLQRHIAKHGSSGRHTCSHCDYSVDRQHILDYHVRNVHRDVTPGSLHLTAPTPPGSEEENVSCPQTPEVDFPLSPPEKDGDGIIKETTSVNGKMWNSRSVNARGSSVRASSDHCIHCIRCGFTCLSATVMKRHRLAHSHWELPHRCPYCPRRASTPRLLKIHCDRIHQDSVVAGKSRHCTKMSKLTCLTCPFKCVDCPQMALHLRRHGSSSMTTNKCRFSCDSCSFAVDVRNALLHHHRLHKK